jgi:hypothetical protein
MVMQRFTGRTMICVSRACCRGSLALAAAIWTAGMGSAQEAQDTTPICADRPTKSNNVCAVDPGVWQLETDFFNATFQHEDGVTTDTYLVTNPTLKYGVAQGWDVEANLVPYEIVRTHDARGSETVEGIGDLFLRVKYAAVAAADAPVQIGFIPYVKLPTAPSGIGNGALEVGVSVPIQVPLSDPWSLGFSPEFDALKDAVGGGRHFNTSQTVVVGYTMPADLTLNAELWGDWNVDRQATVSQYSLDFAAAKLLSKSFQLDGGVNFGLNRATPGVQLYAGLATKF